MKKSLFMVMGGLISLVSVDVNADTTIFNHTGVQKGAMLEVCYHNPCSVAKVINFKQLAKSPNSSMVELTLLGGSRDWDSKKIKWNRKPHKVYATCSIKNPTLMMDDQVTTIPINANGVPGILFNDYQTYMQTCHNFKGSEDVAMKKFGYDVSE